MASPSRYQQQQEAEESRPRRRSKKAGPPIVPILLLLVVMGGAVVIARLAAQNKPVEAPPKEKVLARDIFSDLPVEAPPDRSHLGTGGGKKLVNKAPAGLAENANWLEAKRVAEEAAASLIIAKGAKAAGDHEVWSTKGIEAKELYDKAITMTAVWEEELLAQYGDNDRQVRAIMDERSRWFDLLRSLHKTTGR